MKILIALLLMTQVCFATEVNWEPYQEGKYDHPKSCDPSMGIALTQWDEIEPTLYVWSADELNYNDYFTIVPHPDSNWVVETDRIYNTETGEAWKLIMEE